MRRIGAVVAVFLAVGALTGSAASAASVAAAASVAPSAAPIAGTWSPLVYLGLSGNPSVVNSVSCTGPGDCTAGGAYQSVFEDDELTDSAYVVSEVNGKWGTGEMVPGTAALNTALGAATTAVSCSSPGNCAAVGYYAGGAGAVPGGAFRATERGVVFAGPDGVGP